MINQTKDPIGTGLICVLFSNGQFNFIASVKRRLNDEACWIVGFLWGGGGLNLCPLEQELKTMRHYDAQLINIGC